MKKVILLFVLATSFIFNQFSFGQATDLMFSEYIEGSSNNKALEIFNGTGGEVDLSAYRIVRFNNGSTTVSGTEELTGMLAESAVYVIANPAANAVILAVADITSTITYYNGDDYLGLEKFVIDEWLVIDVIGVLGEDPGSCWPVAGIALGQQRNKHWSEKLIFVHRLTVGLHLLAQMLVILNGLFMIKMILITLELILPIVAVHTFKRKLLQLRIKQFTLEKW